MNEQSCLQEKLTLHKVLNEIELLIAEHQSRTRPTVLSGVQYMTGILNWTIVMVVWSVYPQHFWILYFLEVGYLIPMKFVSNTNSKPLNETLHYLELCWVENIIGLVVMLYLILGRWINLPFPTQDTRNQIFWAFFGMSNGPLYGAAYILPYIAFVPDNIRLTATLYIHIMPPMLFYTLVWHTEAVITSWPSIFSLEYLQGTQQECVPFFPESLTFTKIFTFNGSILCNALALYMVWWVLYVIWQLSIGLDLPRKVRNTRLPNGKPAEAVFDTVFHYTFRSGNVCEVFGVMFWGRPKDVSKKQVETNDFEDRDFVVYMILHFFHVMVSFLTSSFPCCLHKVVHALWLVALFVLCIWKGAKKHVALLRSTVDQTAKEVMNKIASIDVYVKSK